MVRRERQEYNYTCEEMKGRGSREAWSRSKERDSVKVTVLLKHHKNDFKSF